jgi:hypothetical protein
MNPKTKPSGLASSSSGTKDKLSFLGGGKVFVSVSSIVNSPNVQRQVSSVREIAASQAKAKQG